jgi:hypothetical protein
MMPIADLQKILTTSFEAAGLLKAMGKASSPEFAETAEGGK